MLRSTITGKQVTDASQDDAPDEVLKPHDEMRNQAESRAGLRGGVDFYAIMESAYRAAHGWSVDEHRDSLAALYANFSRIAAENPYGCAGI